MSDSPFKFPPRHPRPSPNEPTWAQLSPRRYESLQAVMVDASCQRRRNGCRLGIITPGRARHCLTLPIYNPRASDAEMLAVCAGLMLTVLEGLGASDLVVITDDLTLIRRLYRLSGPYSTWVWELIRLCPGGVELRYTPRKNNQQADAASRHGSHWPYLTASIEERIGGRDQDLLVTPSAP